MIRSHAEGAARGFLVLSGLAIGFAAWTKNEGVLFLFATVAAFLIVSTHGKRQKSPSNKSETPAWPAVAMLLLPAVPVFGLVLWLKHLAPRGDLFSAPQIMLEKMLTPARYWAIVKWYAKEFLRFGEWWPIPATVLLLGPIFHPLRAGRLRQRPTSLRIAVWTLTLTLAGYFAIYVITPNELYWHLRFSLNRLFLQLWPSVIFLFFSSVSFRSFNNVSK